MAAIFRENSSLISYQFNYVFTFNSEIYDYAFRQEDTVYFAQALMSRFVRTKDKRTRELLKEFTRLPFSGDSKQIIAAALRNLMNFKDDETEKIFIDFAVCDDDYLADIAKDYWDDAE